MVGKLRSSFRRNVGRSDVSSIKCFILLACFFMCGAVIGTASGGYAPEDSNNVLACAVSEHLTNIQNSANGGESVLSALFRAFEFPVLAVFFGTSIFGFLLLPPLMAVRGFSIGFASSAMIATFGAEGRLLVFSAYGIGALMTVPCLFILSIRSMQLSEKLFGASVSGIKSGETVGKQQILSLLICMSVVFMAAILDFYLTPYLIRLSASFVV